jgi:hypothetical protein
MCESYDKRSTAGSRAGHLPNASEIFLTVSLISVKFQNPVSDYCDFSTSNSIDLTSKLCVTLYVM